MKRFSGHACIDVFCLPFLGKARKGIDSLFCRTFIGKLFILYKAIVNIIFKTFLEYMKFKLIFLFLFFAGFFNSSKAGR